MNGGEVAGGGPQRPGAVGSGGLLDSADGGGQAIDGAAFTEHRDHLVNPGADGAAGERHAYRLRELPELEA